MDRGSEKSTTTLFDEVSSGRRTAIGQLILLYEPLIEHWVRRYLGPRRFARDGEDVLQSIRVVLIEKLPALRQKSRQSLVAWLQKVVRTKISDWEKTSRATRRHPRRPVISLVATNAPEVAAATPTPSRILHGAEEVERLTLAIESVPMRYRGVLRFIHETNPTPAEVAAYVGKEPDAARKFTARALDHLRRVLRSPSWTKE